MRWHGEEGKRVIVNKGLGFKENLKPFFIVCMFKYEYLIEYLSTQNNLFFNGLESGTMRGGMYL